MESLLIKGGVPLHGEVTISGAKNAVLPILAATLLTAEPCVIRRVPNLSDVKFMAQILTWLGAQVRAKGDTIRVRAEKIKGAGDYDLIRKMRGSICIMGPLLGRLKKATVSLPGGCIIGARPINLHLKGFQALGARVTIEGGYVHASAKRLIGSALFLGGRALFIYLCARVALLVLVLLGVIAGILVQPLLAPLLIPLLPLAIFTAHALQQARERGLLVSGPEVTGDERAGAPPAAARRGD